MAATISHLKLHKVSAVSPSATALFSRQVFSNNITFPFDFDPMCWNHISSKLRVSSTSSAFHKCHAITSTPCKNNSTSTFSSYFSSDLLEQDYDSSSTSRSSIFKLSVDHNVVDMQIMLSRFLKSFLLYGVIAVMTMAMAFCSQNPAFAASYGRMGGSSSSSSKSSSSSSRGSSSYGSSGGSSSYGSSGGSSSYKSSSSSSPSYQWSSRHRSSSYLSDSDQPSNYPTWSSAATPTCICDCHKKDKNIKPISLNSCTDCNCSKEGKVNKEEVQKSKKSKAPWVILALAALGAIAKFVSGGGGPGTVLMVQVGISDKDRVLQKKLNKIADSADTSTVDGLNYVLKGVVKALLEHYDSCKFAYFYDKFGSSMKKSVRPSFEELLNREIDRYDKDGNTLVNVDGVKYKKAVVDKANNNANEYSVVTLLVLASDFKLDESLNRSIGHLKSLLQKIQIIPKSSIESVEVLWTPQREDETVSEQELRRDFPLMKLV